MDEYPSYSDPADLTAEEVLTIAELALEYIEPEDWVNRDSPEAFNKISTLKEYLEHRDADKVKIQVETEKTNDRTLWVTLQNVPDKQFGDFPNRFYLPTEERLDNTADSYGSWY